MKSRILQFKQFSNNLFKLRALIIKTVSTWIYECTFSPCTSLKTGEAIFFATDDDKEEKTRW